ncbi:DUF1129 domain-containing protein [Enterococcus casseliflavus]|nr:DUF1129 domain-containing protein [Enterococcus casseliflavus]
MEPETLRNYVSENRELEQQLTKRNQQYIFDLKKSLEAANLSEEEKTIALHEMLPVLVKRTKKAAKRPANYLVQCLNVPKPSSTNPLSKKESGPFLMWLDNTLLILGIFGLMLGVMGIFTRGQAQPYGLLTLFLMAMLAGWVFYLMYKYMYQYERPGADKSKRPKMWKIILILVAAFMLWIVVISLSAMIQPPLNPQVDPVIEALIGAVALAAKYYLKRKYNIISSLSVPRG